MGKSKENRWDKTSNGITLISLLITVILMMIIAGVAVGNGIQSADNAKLQNFFSELQIIQKRVDVISEEAKIGTNDKIVFSADTQIYTDNVGKNIQWLEDETQKQKIENLKAKNEIITGYDYYYYTPAELKELRIEDIQQDVLINWETRDVVSVDGITIKGTTYYRDPTAYKPEYQGENKKRTTFRIDTTEGEAIKTVNIINEPQEGEQATDNFTVKYKLEEEENWTVATGHRFQTAIPGKYKVQISGNSIVTVEQEVELKPIFKVKQEQIETNQWKYTIVQIFGEYKYPNVTYYYKPSDVEDTEEAWIKVENNTFEVTEQKDYDIKVIHQEDSSQIDAEIVMN